MAASSTMLPLGTRVPQFALTNVTDGAVVRSGDFAGKPLLVMIICNHCPYVIHVRSELGAIASDYLPKGVGIVAVNANSTRTHPQDGPDEMKKLAASQGWRFPFLFDDTQQVAKAFQAACTPEFYLFDASGRLVYRGQLDDSRPGKPVPVTGKALRSALDALLAGAPVSQDQKPGVGCSIKWHPGNEPEYMR